MNTLRKFVLGSMMIGSLGLVSCEDFLDVNTNPNFPTTSTPDLVLPSGQGTVAYQLGGQLQIVGNFYAQHWTQSLVQNQYKQLDRYNLTTEDYDRPWQTLYSGALADLEYVRKNADGDSANYGAVAGLMQAFTFQMLNDTYGDIPFSEALQGAANTQPRFDDGPKVYDGLITLINNSVAKINTQTPVQLGSADLVYGGNMDKWRRFANTLKLRIYMRQVYARPTVAEQGIRELFTSGAQFLAPNETAEVAFFNTTFNENPFWVADFGPASGIKNNVIASETAIDYLTSTNDPRIDQLYSRPGGSATAPHAGAPQGESARQGAPATSNSAFSLPGPAVASPTTPVILISGAESLFLQAEAALRGFSTGNAQALYNQAIEAHFAYLGVSGAAAFLAQPEIDLNQAPGGTFEAKLDRLMTQKWVALNGLQGLESWAEFRRTKYPSFIQPSITSVFAPGVFPGRLPLPISEVQRNPNAPAFVRVDTKVWWDRK